MPPGVVRKALVLWAAILVLAVANGILRESALVPALGALGGLVASGVVLCACIFLVAFLAAPWYGRLAASKCWLIGLLWLVLTLLFEFGFGRVVQHKAWAQLLRAYTFEGGNIWPVVLAVTLVSPWLAARLRGLIRPDAPGAG